MSDSPPARDPRFGRRVTLKQIAEAAGVHPATVSRALNAETAAMISDETRQRVLATASEMGYTPSIPARTLRHGRSETVGIVVANLENPYTGRIIRGVENALEGRGIMALVAETQDDGDRMARVVGHLLSRNVDAIICTGARQGSARLLRKTFDQVPVVLVDRTLPGSGLSAVAPDDAIGGRLAARHLMEIGHRRLAQLEGPRDISSFERRSAGFAAEVADWGAELVEVADVAVEPSVSEGRRLADLLLDDAPAPTAVFAHNDLMALGVLAALRERDLSCPNDLSLVGYDDLPFTEFTSPPLTTVHLPGYQLGRMAAEVAVAMTEDPTHQVTELSVTPRVMERASTAPVAGGLDMVPPVP